MIDVRVRRVRRPIWPMLPAAIQLFLFVVFANGVPLFDAVVLHADTPHTAAGHMESADGPACHAERCVVGLATIAAPPTNGPTCALRTESPFRRVAVFHLDHRLDSRIPASSLGARAPPA